MPYGEIIYDSRADMLMCELCGTWCKSLGQHIRYTHKMKAEEYKKMFGLDKSKSLLSNDMKERLRELVGETGVYKNLEKGQRQRERVRSGQAKIQNYPRSAQTQERLRGLRNKTKSGIFGEKVL